MHVRSFEIGLLCALAVAGCGAPTSTGAPRTARLSTSSSEWVPTPPPPLVNLPASAPVPGALAEPYRTRWTERLELGHPDPRHGVPHEIEIAVSTVWHLEPLRRRVVGFVLPHAASEAAFAIVGPLVVGVETIGPVADLRALCTERLAAVEPEDELPFWDDDPRVRGDDLCSGANAALFLATSDAALANAVAARFDEEHSIHAWAVSALHRALTAHARGNDVIARHDAHVALRLLSRSGENAEYREAARLIARDQDRRALAPRRVPSPSFPAEGEVAAELVPALVEHLDDLEVEPGGNIGGRIILGHSSIVDALVRAGDAAVPALIDTVEHDERLTRSLNSVGVFHPAHAFLTVRIFALHALLEIVGVHHFPSESSRGTAESIREFWDRYGRYEPVERRYRVLADDDATPEQHREVAHWLTSPERFRADAPLAGENLRGRRTPTVSELLARRMNAWGTGYSGCFFASLLHEWSPEDARALSGTFARRCIARADCECAPSMRELMGRHDSAR